jgi:hypothetical protein
MIDVNQCKNVINHAKCFFFYLHYKAKIPQGRNSYHKHGEKTNETKSLDHNMIVKSLNFISNILNVVIYASVVPAEKIKYEFSS